MMIFTFINVGWTPSFRSLLRNSLCAQRTQLGSLARTHHYSGACTLRCYTGKQTTISFAQRPGLAPYTSPYHSAVTRRLSFLIQRERHPWQAVGPLFCASGLGWQRSNKRFEYRTRRPKAWLCSIQLIPPGNWRFSGRLF